MYSPQTQKEIERAVIFLTKKFKSVATLWL